MNLYLFFRRMVTKWFLFVCVQVLFDLSLARGLDYYTGVIYEAILTGEQPDLGKAEKGTNSCGW
jgi:histidyl-tRNA synthetase